MKVRITKDTTRQDLIEMGITDTHTIEKLMQRDPYAFGIANSPTFNVNKIRQHKGAVMLRIVVDSANCVWIWEKHTKVAREPKHPRRLYPSGPYPKRVVVVEEPASPYV